MNLVLCVVCLFLIPLASAGLALIHQGLGRVRSAAHAMLASLCALSVTAVVFALVGTHWAGSGDGTTHLVHTMGRSWDLLGTGPALSDQMRVDTSAGLQLECMLLLQVFAVGMSSLIPLSAGADRWRLLAICVSSALLAGFIFPVFVHAVWGGGILANLNGLFGLPSFVDGGAGAIQVLGGLSALSVVWILGPRHGKYTEGAAAAIPGHHIVLVLFGCLIALVGWIGLDGAIASVVYAAPIGRVLWIAIGAMLSASGGCLAAVLLTLWRYRKPDASLSANGWIAGLVAGSAGCGQLSPLAMVLTGLVAGILVTLLVESLELHLLIDDPGGAISVHAGAGIWGLLAYGLFCPTSASRMALVLSQLVGVAVLLGFMFPLIHVSHLLLNRLTRFRVDRDGDWQGMDIRELGAGAYPEFVIHADDFAPR